MKIKLFVFILLSHFFCEHIVSMDDDDQPAGLKKLVSKASEIERNFNNCRCESFSVRAYMRQPLISKLNEEIKQFLIYNGAAAEVLQIKRDDIFCHIIPSKIYRTCCIHPICIACCCYRGCDKQVLDYACSAEYPDHERAQRNVIKAIAIVQKAQSIKR